jgi:hypothetical protein
MARNIPTNTGQALKVEGLPNKCPFCHKAVTPNLHFGYYYTENQIVVLTSCPNDYCLSGFLSYYQKQLVEGKWYFNFTGRVSQGTHMARYFPEIIREISPSFVTIYNQASVAENHELTEICGVGFRKALEFLIKDYAIRHHPKEQDKIEKLMLGPCIEKYVNDARIKSVSKRAVWLGNDETHYIRKWEGKNLEDMKKLIDLTIHWIEMEQLTASFESEMPE